MWLRLVLCLFCGVLRMKLIKKKFKDEWKIKLKDVENAARVRAQAFIDSEESKIHM